MHDPRSQPAARFRYLDIGGIDGDLHKIQESKELLGAEAPSRARQLVNADDTLVSTVRTYQGKTAIVPRHLDGATASTGFCVLRPSQNVDPRFLFYWVTNPTFVDDLSAKQTGSSYPAVREKDVFGMPLLLPSVSEQRRIVEVIEEQFSRLDAAEASLRRAKMNVSRLRASMLRSAFLLKELPRVRLSSFATVGSGATPLRTRQEYYDNGTIPWVTSGQLVSDYVTAPSTFITELAFSDTAVKLWPKGTLLVAMYGEGRTRGHCSELMIEATTNQACAAIVLHNPSIVHKAFLKLFFKASYEDNRRLASGGVQPNLSLGLIKNMEVPCPTIEAQVRVADELNRRLSVYERIESEIDQSLRRARQLRRTILVAAFEGQLLPDAAPEQAPADSFHAGADRRGAFSVEANGQVRVPGRRRLSA